MPEDIWDGQLCHRRRWTCPWSVAWKTSVRSLTRWVLVEWNSMNPNWNGGTQNQSYRYWTTCIVESNAFFHKLGKKGKVRYRCEVVPHDRALMELSSLRYKASAIPIACHGITSLSWIVIINILNRGIPPFHKNCKADSVQWIVGYGSTGADTIIAFKYAELYTG